MNVRSAQARTAKVAVLVVLIGLMSVRCNDKPTAARTADGEPLIGHDAQESRRYALPVQLVMGTGRTQDTATFGEWARAAYRLRCPDLQAADLAFEVRDGLRNRSEVSITFRPGTRVQPQPSCRPTPPALWIASVRFADLAVVAPDDATSSGFPAADWLERFRRGAATPTSLDQLDVVTTTLVDTGPPMR